MTIEAAKPSSAADLEGRLKNVFGFDSFRPLQREIITASLSGKDVFALLPTGGGKSLCFQLPALFRDGLTLVVSPLIALMKDQVDQLDASGIPATFLNSSLTASETKLRMRGLHEGRWKILYAAPERLMLDHWRENLLAWNVKALAIDEAHCISEWGHDFRPEYRRLAQLRKLLPEIPVMALTATATGRVREDILARLAMRDAAVFVSSFNRPNLHYRVVPKHQPSRQVADFLKRRPGESGIVYCSTRASTERLAESLKGAGFSAAPYHAGLSSAERGRNQDLFLRDEIRVVCATIAFGMGINKPNVRWVVHYDLPKNIEGYYQETGRAGRDGLPAECLLLFSAGDAAKQTHFIDEMSNPDEQRVARLQLRKMIHYAECPTCRRREILAYFGEEYPAEQCAACDNCIEPPASYDGTIPAQKFLSCVYRVRQALGFAVGMNHIVEVLTGSRSEKVLRWGHDRLSTYGIGAEMSRPEWAAVGRELLRLGFLAQATGEFPTIEISERGLETLRKREPVRLRRGMVSAGGGKPRGKPRKGEIECDEVLFGRLRELRKQLADERGVPAYVVFGDVTLRQMARLYPCDPAEMGAISGVGEKKLAEFGEAFAACIRDYLESNPKSRFTD